MWPGLVPLESTGVQPVANVGTSLSTAQSVQLLYPLTVWCTCGKVILKIFTAFAILRGTVTTSTKEGCALDFGLVIVRVTNLVTPTRGGSLCPGSSLKKFLRLSPRYRDKTSVLGVRVTGRSIIVMAVNDHIKSCRMLWKMLALVCLYL